MKICSPFNQLLFKSFAFQIGPKFDLQCVFDEKINIFDAFEEKSQKKLNKAAGSLISTVTILVLV